MSSGGFPYQRWAGAALLVFVGLYFADEVLLRLYDDVGLAPRQLVRFAFYSALGLALLLGLRFSSGLGLVVCGVLSLAQAFGLWYAVASGFISYRMYPEVHIVLWALRVASVAAAFVLLVLAVRARAVVGSRVA